MRVFVAGATGAIGKQLVPGLAAGAIIGSAIPLAAALSETWQYVVLTAAALAIPHSRCA